MPSSLLPSASTSSVLTSMSAGTSGARGFSLYSAIDPLLERLRADPPVGVDEALAVAARLEIGRDQRIDRLDHLVGLDRRPEDRAERGLAEVDVAAQAQLVELDAVLVDAQDADVADMVMAAGIDAARDLDLEVADIMLARKLGEVVGDALRHRDRARIGQRAVIEPRTGDDVGDLADIGF